MALKIIKHCQEEGQGGSELVQGVLLGLVENNKLEVTNCFPFPRHTEEDEFDEGKIRQGNNMTVFSKQIHITIFNLPSLYWAS